MWTAFILYSHSLFARGLETLLQGQQGLVVTGMGLKGDEAVARIKLLKPDVVIVEADPAEFEPEQMLASFLREQPRARMVRLNLQDNTAIFYSGSRCTATSLEDLIRCLSALLTRE
jgi:DNA-binding NarL/FixJ family response regulator